MAGDFIPRTDAEFNDWAKNLVDVISASPTDYGLTSAQATALAAERAVWENDYGACLTNLLAYRASVPTKDNTRGVYDGMLRQANAQAQAYSGCTDAMKELAGLPVHDTTRTRAPVATTGVIIISAAPISALEAKLEFRDQATPDTKAKPRGQKYAEICSQVGGTAPLNGDDMTSMGLDGATPYTAVFEAGDENKVVYYCARWINTRGEKGPWGPVFASSVPGAGGGA